MLAIEISSVILLTPDCIHNAKVAHGMSDHATMTTFCDTKTHTCKKTMIVQANNDSIQKDLSPDAKRIPNPKHLEHFERWYFSKEALAISIAKHIPFKTISRSMKFPYIATQNERVKYTKHRYDVRKKYGQQDVLFDNKGGTDHIEGTHKIHQ